MDEYKWWGRQGQPPPNLKTKKQLAELGLAPLKPVGIIKTLKL
jgi:DNA polymerase-3 subunit epsilon